MRSVRRWAYEMFRNERAIKFVVMVTPEDLKANAGEHFIDLNSRLCVKHHWLFMESYQIRFYRKTFITFSGCFWEINSEGEIQCFISIKQLKDTFCVIISCKGRCHEWWCCFIGHDHGFLSQLSFVFSCLSLSSLYNCPVQFFCLFFSFHVPSKFYVLVSLI